MLQSMFIQNFKAWENKTFTFNGEHAVFVGESDSGKSSVLQALDFFFNRDQIESAYIRNPDQDVAIGIRYDGITYKKVFSCKTRQVKTRKPAALWGKVDEIHYIYLPSTFKTTDTVMKELAKARADALFSQEVERALATVADRAMAQVLESIGALPSAESEHTAKVTAEPRVNPTRAIDFMFENNGVPVAGAEIGYQKRLTYAMLVGSQYDNVVLGVDDVEQAFKQMDFAKVIAGLESHIGQVLMTTRSFPVVKHKGVAVTVPVGRQLTGDMAAMLKGLQGEGKTFLLVEGKFDLPWYRCAVNVIGLNDQLNILPAGGTNLDELRCELENAGMGCIAIVDGDTPPHESVGKYALKRECVELYTPDDLLQSLFGFIPSVDGKRDFFEGIQARRQISENGIKAVISERIGDYLDSRSPFVIEIRNILERGLR